MESELTSSYRLAEWTARQRARNFYYSFVVLPREKRRALCAVYAFMRFCDDISDSEESLDAKQAGLQRWRQRLDAILAGDLPHNSIFPAFRDSIQRFSIPVQYFHWIIDGAEMDLAVDRYETFDELYRYCFNVASAVGLVCLHIFGFRDDCAKQYAEHCGIAFQLTNILRDVREDAEMGRIYIPEEDLRRFGYQPVELRKGILDERFRRLMTFEVERAGEYYTRGRKLLPLVDPISRPSLWAMIEIYSRILGKIRRRNYDVFRDRVRLPDSEKAMIMCRALAARFLPVTRPF